MSNTVITNYTDLNGPSTKTDSSVVVIVNKDGSLSVDQKLLGTLMGSDGSQAAGISVVRVGHEGRPDDATDSENEDEKIPHVTLSVDSYYDEPDSIIKYDSGAEMLQSLRIETRENSLIGFQNDHCYTPLTSPSQLLPQKNETLIGYDEPVIEIMHTPPPKPVTTPKKITILDQQIIPKGKKIILNPSESSVILKGNDVLTKPLSIFNKSKPTDEKKSNKLKLDVPSDSSSASSSVESPLDRDSDSDYKDTKDKSGTYKLKTKLKSKPRILKSVQSTKSLKSELKTTPKLKANKNLLKRDLKDRVLTKSLNIAKKSAGYKLNAKDTDPHVTTPVTPSATIDPNKLFSKITPKPSKKEKKTPAHMTALLSDMTSLFSTPDVIRRISTETKVPGKPERESIESTKNSSDIGRSTHLAAEKVDISKQLDNIEQPKPAILQKTNIKQMKISNIKEKSTKNYDPIPQLDDASLAQILQDPTQASAKSQPILPTASVINSPGLAGPLSPTLDLLGGLQPEEDGLTEDLLMHVAQLVESSENLQEVIDKQVLGKVDTVPVTAEAPKPIQHQQTHTNMFIQTPVKPPKAVQPRKDPIEIIRRDGRVITLPPIEAPATRASKRKNQVESAMATEVDLASIPIPPSPIQPISVTPEPAIVPQVSRQYSNKKLSLKKHEVPAPQIPLLSQPEIIEKISAESQESWNSEDDPNRLWCICKQPHNNRFMICCDGCEDWFHGKCVNITKVMGQQMEEQGIEWRCPNCIKNTKTRERTSTKPVAAPKDPVGVSTSPSANNKEVATKTTCIVCKKIARASSIYCSDACILKHAQDSLGSPPGTSKAETSGRAAEKQKAESRVIVYERKSGRLLAGPNAPTAENLKTWLQKNPTFEVVRPGTLSTIKPNLAKKKLESNKIQTTLNFTKIPKKVDNIPIKNMPESPKEKEKMSKTLQSPTPAEETKIPSPRTPSTSKSLPNIFDTPKSSIKAQNEPKKLAKASTSRAQAVHEKPSVSPSTSRRRDTPDRRPRMSSEDPVRENVRKALQEHMSIRMAENKGPRFTETEIQEFANETELELHELFNRDVGMKYKAKYRSLMFNIKDRKNLTLWEKICERIITPKQLVRLSPEELASQELAQWRDKEAKHQLELIKKSELDLLAASKTYVLKTHKGEEVMETKKSVSTELDPNVAVEDLVTVLNDVADPTVDAAPADTNTLKKDGDKKQSKKKEKDRGSNTKKKDIESKKDAENVKSRSSRRKSDLKVKEKRSTRRSERKCSRSERKPSRSRSKSKDRSKMDKSDNRDRSRHRSRSMARSKRKSREHSRSPSRGRGRSRSAKRSSRRSSSDRSSTRQKRRRRSRSKNRQSSTDEIFKHRSKSQESPYRKTKNDSTDSDSIERPKSAMMKEQHPEYDPHEPMITSAFSEEDLRKSREDVYDESYRTDIGDYGIADYDSSKAFSIGSSILDYRYSDKQDKASEAESDQEPSSTVEHSTATVWNGCINMVDVARFYVAGHEVSGNATDLEDDLTPELDIVGRINPETVWDYINKMKRASNKDIVILKLQAANDEEKMQYIALYSYLSSRNRLGVVKVSNTATVKDLYIVPLAAHSTLPAALLPLDGPGMGELRTHLLLAIIIRQRKRRLPHHPPKDAVPAKMSRESRKKSYTPPLSPRRRALPLPPPAYTSPALSTSVKDKIAATLASADDDEAYSPGSSTGSSSNAASVPASSDTLRSKMEELNRQIEEQKQQILKMAQADSTAAGENEAYSPSRPLTPSPAPVVPLADISLPSNLHEILATIKQRTEHVVADVDMRTAPLS